jgi:hypothetical protein
MGVPAMISVSQQIILTVIEHNDRREYRPAGDVIPVILAGCLIDARAGLQVGIERDVRQWETDVAAPYSTARCCGGSAHRLDLPGRQTTSQRINDDDAGDLMEAKQPRLRDLLGMSQHLPQFLAWQQSDSCSMCI